MSYNLGLKFKQVAQNFSDSTCLKFSIQEEYLFKDLDHRSDQLASYLINLNLKKSDVIVVLNNKSFNAFALMVACLKTGIIYTNLDPASPSQRAEKITLRCSPSYVFSDFEEGELTELDPLYEKNLIRLANIDFNSLHLKSEITDQISRRMNAVCGTDPAYIMFTSGSTGFPKGAVMTHSNVISFLDWSINITKPQAHDVFTNVNPIYFDNSVFDFYTAIFSGSALAPIKTNITKDPKKLVDKVEELKCTIWFSVPSLLVYLLTTRMINGRNFPDLRLFIFGGEGFPKPKLKQLFDFYHQRASLLNVYGPTECTCICSEYFISETDFSDMNNLAPLGGMTKNFYYQIVDDHMRPARQGELLLGGANVGAGYYNDIERTETAFIQNPRHSNYRDIMYRTGDLVEFGNDGLVHFKGRVDNQIKHMGYRIELEEIEAGLNTIEGVKEAAVVYKRMGLGMGQILGFIASDEELNEKELIELLKLKVPDYMVPRRVTVLKALPKNQNGKIDRKSLLD